ncbi:hypothetical protein FACS1894191_2840 [Clostridia bacterium]|nr:hypothetical protein FACS1894191_2840 [Clostridia bacterium]
MLQNLAKSPLMAVFFASLLYFAGLFVPYSDEYLAASSEFAMPLLGYLFLLAFALWISLTFALAFGAAEKKSLITAGLLFASVLGSVWAIPNTEPLLFGPAPGKMGFWDTVFSSGRGAACTVIILVLAVLLFKTALYAKPEEEPEEKQPKKREEEPAEKPVYKLKIIELAIKVVVLPLIFCVLFFISWYFLHWTNSDVRAFYEGSPEVSGIIPAIVNVLLYDTWMLYMVLLEGLAYALFALPLLFLFPGKRMIFVASLTLIYLGGALWGLIPTPFMPDNIRLSTSVYTAALMLVFGVGAGFLLHTSFKKTAVEAVAEEPAPAPAPKRRSRSAAAPAAERK